jgi:hypothetical protein
MPEQLQLSEKSKQTILYCLENMKSNPDQNVLLPLDLTGGELMRIDCYLDLMDMHFCRRFFVLNIYANYAISDLPF